MKRFDYDVEFSFSDISEFSKKNEKYQCRVKCSFCSKKVICNYCSHWVVSNLEFHLKSHIQSNAKSNDKTIKEASKVLFIVEKKI